MVARRNDSNGKQCRYCGKRGGHTAGCTRRVRRPRPAPPAKKFAKVGPCLEAARDWFDRFGLDETCISPTGRELFGWMLRELENRGRTNG